MTSPSLYIDKNKNVLTLVFDGQHGFKFTLTNESYSDGVRGVHETHKNWQTVSDETVDELKKIAGTVGHRMLTMKNLIPNDDHCYFVSLNEKFRPVILLQCNDEKITIFQLKQMDEENVFTEKSDDEEEY